MNAISFDEGDGLEGVRCSPNGAKKLYKILTQNVFQLPHKTIHTIALPQNEISVIKAKKSRIVYEIQKRIKIGKKLKKGKQEHIT
jgi:hypothetical protein